MQGSVLGPVLFAIFIAPILEIDPLTIFADDNYVIKASKTEEELKNKLKESTTKVFDWMSNSGLSINLAKTELVIFTPKKQQIIIDFKVHNIQIKSKNEMKILGVIFDSSLRWSNHIAKVCGETSRIAYGLKKLKKYLDLDELLKLVTTLGYSKLYYGAAVWLNSGLHSQNLQMLRRTTVKLIRSCVDQVAWSLVSFNDLHVLAGKPTPEQMMNYTCAMTLKRIFDSRKPSLVWMKLQQNFRYNARTGLIHFGKDHVALSRDLNFGNRVQHVSGRLTPGWELWSLPRFKNMAKSAFFQ